MSSHDVMYVPLLEPTSARGLWTNQTIAEQQFVS